jgi:hypothetical protein
VNNYLKHWRGRLLAQTNILVLSTMLRMPPNYEYSFTNQDWNSEGEILAGVFLEACADLAMVDPPDELAELNDHLEKSQLFANKPGNYF